MYLIKGDDPALVAQALDRLVGEIVEDRSELTVEDLPVDVSMPAIIDACQTGSLLASRRVVIVRDAGRFRAAEAEPLVDYLASPLPTTSLILLSGGGALPTRVTKAVKEHGHLIDASSPSGKGRQIWMAEQLKRAPVRLDRRAGELILDRLGDELGQLAGVFDALAAAYGENATVSSEDIEPFLGMNGTAAPWELTDAIDSGDTATALSQLHRMLAGGQRHPLVIMATLQRHFGALLRLDGAGVTTEAEAAAATGLSPYPAKKALAQAKRLGSKGIFRAVQLISEADVHLRGASSWSGELILEVLVARLSRLTLARGDKAGSRRAS